MKKKTIETIAFIIFLIFLHFSYLILGAVACLKDLIPNWVYVSGAALFTLVLPAWIGVEMEELFKKSENRPLEDEKIE